MRRRFSYSATSSIYIRFTRSKPIQREREGRFLFVAVTLWNDSYSAYVTRKDQGLLCAIRKCRFAIFISLSVGDDEQWPFEYATLHFDFHPSHYYEFGKKIVGLLMHVIVIGKF